ncbi:MAG: ChaN family lipoprotein [bacterium]
MRRSIAVSSLVALTISCASSGPPRLGPDTVVGLRVHQSATNSTVPFAEMVATAARADIVFFGEEHDDPETHFAEFALLEGIGRLRPNVVLSLEMFERDVQPMLDDYLGGRMSEADFLAKSRPWDRYATDYRPLVQLARARGWPVVAANVPRPIASAVGRRGLVALDSLPPASRAWAARDNNCPRDRYYELFADQMKGHTMPDTGMVGRFYAAQCVKDETMGESIANALARAGHDAIVVHFDGSFHSDFGLGTVARTLVRVPRARSLVITAVPVADPLGAGASEFAKRADFVIFSKR